MADEVFDERKFRKQMQDQLWRLNNLYYIVTKDGERIKFQMNWAQEDLYRDMWYRNIILKARQLGMSTFIGILQLDTAMFNPNIFCGTVAHSLEAVGELFNRNIYLPYKNLPQGIRDANPVKSKTQSKIEFANDSQVRVATSLRSGTIHVLHISEFGKLCAKFPEKAREVVTGTIEAVGLDGMVFIESTAEGREGYYYSYCKTAEEMKIRGKQLNQLDYKFFFYPWWKHPDYKLSDKDVVITEERREYFEKLQETIGVKLLDEQKSWYISKAITQGEDMLREYPSTPEEAFHHSILGAYFPAEMRRIREEKRIGDFPHNPSSGVFTAWDLGVSDSTVILFFQRQGAFINFINYYENSSVGLDHYAQILQEYSYKYGYTYTNHFGPHDLAVFEIGANTTRFETARQLGINFTVIPRTIRKADSIQAERNMLAVSRFHEENCSRVIQAVDEYQREWNETLGRYNDKPRHDWASHFNDAMQTAAAGLSFKLGKEKLATVARQRPPALGWT